MQQAHHFETQVQQQIGYLLYLPKDYAIDLAQPWPLLVFLHGMSKRGGDLELLKTDGLPKRLEEHHDFPFVVVSPQCPAESWWVFEVEAVKRLIDHILAEYAVDPKRVYLTGMSMGGYGTWALATTYPDIFAAIAPVSGGGIPLLADKLKDVPVWAFHGDADDVVPIAESQQMVDALQAVGGNIKFTVYPGGGHWTPTYENPELYNWFLSHQRT